METISFAHGWDSPRPPQESGSSAGTLLSSDQSSPQDGTPFSILPTTTLSTTRSNPSKTSSSWSKSLLPCLPPAVILMSLQAGGGTALAATNLAHGMDNADVASLQYKLARLGYFQEHNTGYFGDRTESAVRQFQEAAGLQVDGIVGDETWSALKAQASSSTPIAVVSPPENSGFESFADFETSGIAIETEPQYSHSSDMEVLEIQSQLQSLGYNPGPIDGILGPQTTSAIRDFQMARGLIVDGIVGPQTWSALQQSATEAPNSSFETLPKMEEVVFGDLGAEYEILPVPELPF
ncbi:MAG: endopeptidase cell wall lytic [Cyanobacteriota bacterium]